MKVSLFVLVFFTSIVYATEHVEDLPTSAQWSSLSVSTGISKKVLYSIALIESGKTRQGKFLPHPYALALGVDHDVGQTKHIGLYPDTKLEAETILRGLLKSGFKNIGIGLMQVNIMANPNIVDDYLDLLDPQSNLLAAEKVLKWCTKYKDIKNVLACYSHGNPKSLKGQEYAKRVQSYTQKYAHNVFEEAFTGKLSYAQLLQIVSQKTRISGRTPNSIVQLAN